MAALLNATLPDGTQRFYADPATVKWFPREMSTYVRNDPKNRILHEPSEIPRQVGDHSIDSGRYLIQAMFKQRWLSFDEERPVYTGEVVRTTRVA